MTSEDGQLVAEQPLYETLWNYYGQEVYCRVAKVKGQHSKGEGINWEWKKWAVLPNIEGQKYTLGNKFTSREEEGELLFWDRDNGNRNRDVELKQMCQITVMNNKFWIHPLMGNRVALNDVEIETKEELKFGDRLSIGMKPRDYAKHWIFKPSPTDFVFEKREAPKMDIGGGKVSFKQGVGRRNQIQDNVASAVGQNSLILHFVFAYFPVSILKELRFVCKTWNEEAVKVLQKKGEISFKFHGFRPYHHPSQSMKFLNYSWDLRNNPIPNYSLHFPVLITRDDPRQFYYSEYLDSSEESPGFKLLSDVDRFFYKCSIDHPVKSLVLNGGIESKADFDIRIKVLEHVQATLEQLDFRCVWRQGQREMTNFTFPSSIVFKKLKTMSIRTWGQGSEARLRIWLQPFILASKGVSSLQISGNSETANVTILKAINNFINLEEITLIGTRPKEHELLLDFKKPLKKLRLSHTNWKTFDQIRYMEYLERLIIYHAPTLEDLHFMIPRLTLTVPATIQFPVLPVLKKLEIGMAVNYRQQTLVFPIAEGNKIDYAHHLPVLESLSLYPKDWTDHYSNPFFQAGQVCKTLKTLVFDGFPNHDRISELVVIFPNILWYP